VFADALWNTADISTAISPLFFASDFQMNYPSFSQLHQATMPPNFEMSGHDRQTREHAGIHDREGMPHIAPIPQLGQRDGHRRIGHRLVQ